MARTESRIARRGLLALAAGALLAGPALAQRKVQGKSQPQPRRITVWKGPTCGCCGDWIEHLEAHGFKAEVRAVGNSDARHNLGMPLELGSCHTALVDGYVIEGHVPAADILRLLAERPKALGLAVPGMPIGSPGMDGPAYGGRRDAFDVLLVQPGGKTQVYSHHG